MLTTVIALILLLAPMCTLNYTLDLNLMCLKYILVVLNIISDGIRVLLMPLFFGKAFNKYTGYSSEIWRISVCRCSSKRNQIMPCLSNLNIFI